MIQKIRNKYINHKLQKSFALLQYNGMLTDEQFEAFKNHPNMRAYFDSVQKYAEHIRALKPQDDVDTLRAFDTLFRTKGITFQEPFRIKKMRATRSPLTKSPREKLREEALKNRGRCRHAAFFCVDVMRELGLDAIICSVNFPLNETAPQQYIASEPNHMLVQIRKFKVDDMVLDNLYHDPTNCMHLLRLADTCSLMSLHSEPASVMHLTALGGVDIYDTASVRWDNDPGVNKATFNRVARMLKNRNQKSIIVAEDGLLQYGSQTPYPKWLPPLISKKQHKNALKAVKRKTRINR